MIIWNLFFSTVLLPLVAIALLWHKARQPAGPWLATLILTSGMVGFSVLAAPWGWFGLVLRFLLVLLFAIAVFGSWRRPVPDPPREETPVRMLLKIIIGFFFGMVAVGVLSGHSVPDEVVDVAFPLKGGTYLVAHGGSSSPANIHAGHQQQSYAVDLVAVNALGFRARGIYPERPERYAIWGAAVVSPCDGEVVSAVDGVPDHPVGLLHEENPAGNHVIVRCHGIDITLAHMMSGSVAVRGGEGIAKGQTLGRVGNSGNTTEPHLRVHGERNGDAVALRFDGRWLVRNGVVRRP
jgi:hypothetical protein